MKKIIQIIMAILLAMPVIGQQTVRLEDVPEQSPGEVFIPLKMLGFTSTKVGSITFQIQFDDNLLDFTGTGYVNPAFAADMVINNPVPNTLRIVYSNMVGANINGPLVDLKFNYAGSFAGDLTFDEFYCEVTDTYFNEFTPIYDPGTISPETSNDWLVIGSNIAIAGNPVGVPVQMFGPDFMAVNSITLRIAYDQVKLTYVNFTLPAFSGITAGVANGIITLTWSSLTPVDLSAVTSLLQLNFTYLGGGTATIACQPGSKITGSNGVEITTQFFAGSVTTSGSYTGSLSIEQHTAGANDTLNVPVTVTANNIPANLGAVCLKFSYVPDDSLVYKGYTAIQPLSWSVSQVGGTITFILANSSGFNITNGPLLTLKFDYLLENQRNIEFKAGTFFEDKFGINQNVELINGFLTRCNPSIVDQPVNSVINFGSNASFTVNATTPCYYKWQIKPSGGSWTDLTNDAPYSGVSTATLTVTNPSLAFTTNLYRCVLGPLTWTNEVAIVFNDAQVTVQPTDQTENLGETATFSLTATGVSSYQWWYRESASAPSWTIFNGQTLPSVTTPPVTAANNGWQVKCIVQPGDVSSSIATLHVNPLVVNAKVLLQGPYNVTTHLMATTLRTKAYFPLVQPYSADPWKYDGLETVGDVPVGVVDWILVELRTGTTGATMVDRKVGFLKSDGSIVGIDGINPLSFPARDIGDYYIVVRHRNHLAIMSAAAQPLSSTSVLYDFTSAVDKSYGSPYNPALLASDGRAVMIGADVNSNGTARANGPAIVNDLTMLRNHCGISTLNEYSTFDVSLDGVSRANGPALVNDATKTSQFLGITTYTSKVPN